MLALLATLAYLIWRTAATLDLSVWWVSLPLLLLEAHAAVGLALFAFSLWDVDSLAPAPVTARAPWRVAVLIPTYNEPEEVLLPAIAAAVALEPAHETWVLDDGDRPEVRALAEELGARYRSRRERVHAKAGNLNEALAAIDAELVAILDADHVASPALLQHTLGYFRDPRIALVQTPQDFYNAESFEHVPRRRGWLARHERRAYNEQALFYRAIQPGKNRWQAAFWCGTGAVVRVAALRDVGGVATGSVTEDMETTLRLHRAGWRTAYHNEVLARGLAAATVEQYALQRHRWCTGAMQILRSERPWLGRGLSLGQRLAYASTLLGWFDAWRTLGYLLLPLAVLFTGASPFRAPWSLFAACFGTTFLLQQLALWRLGRGHSRPLPTLIFELVRMTSTLAATTTVLVGGRRQFRVTPKGRTDGDRSRFRPPPLLSAVLAVSICAGGWYGATLAGWTPLTYRTPAVAHGAFFWLVCNALLVAGAIRRVVAERYAGERRASVRFEVQRPAALDDQVCELLDVSLTGARIKLRGPGFAEHAVGSTVQLRLPLHDGLASYRCVVRTSEPVDGGAVRLGLELVGTSARERARLALWAFRLHDHTGAVPAAPRARDVAHMPAA